MSDESEGNDARRGGQPNAEHNNYNVDSVTVPDVASKNLTDMSFDHTLPLPPPLPVNFEDSLWQFNNPSNPVQGPPDLPAGYSRVTSKPIPHMGSGK